MLDLKLAFADKQALKENILKRGLSIDIDSLEELYQERARLVTEHQQLQADSNHIARSIKSADTAQRHALVERGKELKVLIQKKKVELESVEAEFQAKSLELPNWTHPAVPVGGEDAFNTLKQHSEPKVFDFEVKDHLHLMKELDLLDFESAAKVTGSKFYFLKNEAVWLEQALIMYALSVAGRYGFTPYTTPDLARGEILKGIGFNPKGPEAQIYSLEGEDLHLIGTSEITLGGAYAGKLLEHSTVSMVGISHCFRRESGAYGSHSKGLYRVHQFTKIELFVITPPEESSCQHERLLAIEEELFQGLELPYRVIDVASGDLGAPASRKFDIEAWMPAKDGGSYGEVTSTSNCLDYQARRLKMRMRSASGELYTPHTLNGTAFAIPRVILALIENGQNRDGSIDIPKALHPYLPFKKISGKI